MEKLQKKGLKKYLPYILGVFILLAATGTCSFDGNMEELRTQILELQASGSEEHPDNGGYSSTGI